MYKTEAELAEAQRLIGELYAENALLKKNLVELTGKTSRRKSDEVYKMIENSYLPLIKASETLGVNVRSYYKWKRRKEPVSRNV